MSNRTKKTDLICLLAGLFACAFAVSAVSGQTNQAQTGAGKSQPAQQAVAAATAAPAGRSNALSHLGSDSVLNSRAKREYLARWGIDNVMVKQAASGALIRFSYRVVDPNKAKVLNDEKITPMLIDETGRFALQIPEMDQIGKMRQTAAPDAGIEYWMLFSNKGGYVKLGSHVDVVIGNVKLRGLLVQ